ncbi:class F sortase [Streptomyces sp. KR80]|uniref:class F sortase n=1 Tax=Streptomyces sp. KR80 TaxID=3457426 RepID=UPI003FCF39BC
MPATDRQIRGAYGQERRQSSPWGLMALVLLVGVALLRNGVHEASGPPQPTGDSAAVSVLGLPPSPAALPGSPPARVKIPAIRVDAPLTAVGLDAEGWLASPPTKERNLAGWFKGAVTPGEKGTAVVVGHVDNARGPGVFYDLGALKKGHRVEVVRKDGRTAVFGMYGIEVFAKESFPAPRVYDDTGHPELRVITCGGDFSEAGGYDGNVVVFARLVQVR